MTDRGRVMTHAEAQRVLTRAGLAPEVIANLLGELPDPIDIDSAEPTFMKYGITMDRLTDRLGGSP
jgi:hypothetical protein